MAQHERTHRPVALVCCVDGGRTRPGRRRILPPCPSPVILQRNRPAYCVFAHDAVRLLTAHGRRAVRLADGMLEWLLADQPVAT